MVPTNKGVKLNRRKLETLKNATLAIQDFILKGSAQYPCLPLTHIDMQSLERLLNIPDVNY